MIFAAMYGTYSTPVILIKTIILKQLFTKVKTSEFANQNGWNALF